MKAARLYEYNKPLRIEEVPNPVLTDPTDVIIKVAGAGVCHTDLHLIEGVWAETLGTELPYVIGHENAGWVHEVGSAVSGFKVGDPVILHPVSSCGKCLDCRSGEDMHCENLKFSGLTVDGGYAEYLKTSERALIKLPDNVDPTDVAPFADAGITAYRAVRKAAPLAKPGTKLLMIGMGGLGHIGVQVMRELGNADIIAVDRDEGRLAMALDLGASHTVIADKDMISQVKTLTDEKGVDIIIDFVGTDQTHEDSMKMLRKGGHYFVVGYGGTVKVPSLNIINNEYSIIGSLVGNYTDLYELMVLHGRGKVKLHSSKYPLDQANEVLELLHNGKINGRAILVP
ncbi:NAD(P)-dependent alcohol dehydrogenase [Fictibacillus sp. WQ 8-8]|uniref:NAD(P)-dependent alcohol dehydrogenase n=1 Tax=Fictibacillus sp. WQ 8-8 TaxID=2938788 RepID=UPI00210C9AE3|nr:NAD(P)-dependent alcohol dehydrogenase [Fictibacillus sp. WQ 8-8]MCQ6267784.1 NAD(P)-dependent alcohol dehydrogenase [Fictibacillus sp. WQ 8-8]